MVDLCRPRSKALSGNPFTPKFGVAVDMFPHTAHMELVLVFERDSENVTGEVEDSKVSAIDTVTHVVDVNTTEDQSVV